ncbi:glycoside hydrolase [Chloroflexi bacterium TSY]|nr:glycoside hydrolase [Chloroflexi bacterium TSY]
MHTHSNPSGDAMNMAVVVSEDEGYTWSPPKRTNIWGFPAELEYLPDGQVLMIYGYRQPSYGVRGCISEDGINWDIKNEFVIREGGVPDGGDTETVNRFTGQKFGIDWHNPGVFQHIGYPSLVVLDSGKILALYHD